MPTHHPRVAQAAPDSAGRRSARGRARALLSGLAVVGLAAFLLLSAWSDHRATVRAGNRLLAVHAATVALEHQLDQAETLFSGRLAQTRAAGLALLAASGHLAQARTRLADDRAALYATGVNIAQLDTCLAGAQDAVDQLSLGYKAGAGASAQAAAASCSAAADDGA